MVIPIKKTKGSKTRTISLGSLKDNKDNIMDLPYGLYTKWFELD